MTHTNKEIKVNIQNLFFEGGVIIPIEDLIEIFQYSIDKDLVTVGKRKGRNTVSKKEVKK